MPSINRIENKNGKVVYRIIISLGYDNQGNKLKKTMTYSVNQSATKKQQEKEALKYAFDIEDKIKNGHDYETDKITFEDFAYKWLDDVKDSVVYSSYKSYKQLIEDNMIPYFKGYKISNIKTPLIEAFYKTLINRYSISSLKKHASVLSGMFKTAIRWNMIEINPVHNARIPKKNNEEIKVKYFTPQQCLMFLKSLDIAYEIKVDSFIRTDSAGNKHIVSAQIKHISVPLQLKVFYTLSLFCGFRKGETLALKWNDIDFDKQEIIITKTVSRDESGVCIKKPKTKTSIRVVSFPKQIISLLKQYRQAYNEYRLKLGSYWKGNDNVFISSEGGLPAVNNSYKYLQNHLEKYNDWVNEHSKEAKLNGLERLPIIPLHGLRHSCATLLNYLDVNIIDISKYLGHANSSTTMNIYAHSFNEQQREATNKLEDYLTKVQAI
ncbi:site-specific integrase [Sedimentibacter sp.]|uniref:tyrosine-type recombinase/integrase n=1 Tax=Sedimentibacter sp. TaxID=1960295 RepID=UPI0028AB0C28|nr:site-specific integrase [Sedimentibacter sp.]